MIFRLALSVLAGLYALVPVTSGLVYPMDPRTNICSISYHQSAMIGTDLYIDGGYIWYNNGTNHLGPNVWLGVLDTSKKFTVTIPNEIPIEFLERPVEVVEITAGSLWAHNGSLYQQAGYSEQADVDFPGWNDFPNGSVFDFWKYDVKEKSWEIFQHNPTTTNNTPIRRIQHAQSITIEGLDKGFVISGRQQGSSAGGNWTNYNGMLVYDYKEKTWEHKDTRWGAWKMGVVNHLAFNDSSSGYILGFAGDSREGGRMDLIEVYDLGFTDWRKPQPATAADERDAIPQPRVKPCSVIARAKDGSSYNIYMFGGASFDHNSFGYGEVWVLSLPSFRWFLVNTGLPAMSGTPRAYEAMTCHIAGGGSTMLVYGGRNGSAYQRECFDQTGIHVFDMTSLTWEEVYDPNNGEYQVPKQIYDVIGGGPYGGATLLPKNGMANSEMEAAFKKIIAKTSPKSGVSGGAIAGVVVGVLVGISLIILEILCLRKRSKARARDTELPKFEVDGISIKEMSTTLAPRELHPYGFAPHAQELHAYMPHEMASTPDEGQHTETSHHEPVKLESSAG